MSGSIVQHQPLKDWTWSSHSQDIWRSLEELRIAREEEQNKRKRVPHPEEQHLARELVEVAFQEGDLLVSALGGADGGDGGDELEA